MLQHPRLYPRTRTNDCPHPGCVDDERVWKIPRLSLPWKGGSQRMYSAMTPAISIVSRSCPMARNSVRRRRPKRARAAAPATDAAWRSMAVAARRTGRRRPSTRAAWHDARRPEQPGNALPDGTPSLSGVRSAQTVERPQPTGGRCRAVAVARDRDAFWEGTRASPAVVSGDPRLSPRTCPATTAAIPTTSPSAESQPLRPSNSPGRRQAASTSGTCPTSPWVDPSGRTRSVADPFRPGASPTIGASQAADGSRDCWNLPCSTPKRSTSFQSSARYSSGGTRYAVTMP